tara:strand:- start:371 stop:1048 length:678 start_codon:yes stop_codon:yes gene_type:complete
MKKIILLSEKSWHLKIFNELRLENNNYNWVHIDNIHHFKLEKIKKISPEYIMIPHWSYIIPQEIYNNFTCIVFHMTDLPFGRGGSPLQNLIVRGYKKTKISALKVTQGIDSGPIYIKKPLSLEGTASEIMLRASEIIKKMISTIILKKIKPEEQTGNIVKFKRRRPQDSDISQLKTLNKIHDYIRMLDCDGYPSAFFENEYFKFEFSKSRLIEDKIEAHVRILKK